MNFSEEKKRLIKYVQKKKSLDIHDKNSLLQSLNSFADFGFDSENYFSARKLPDSVLYWYLRVLGKFGFPVTLVREADRYKWMLYLCIQQNWISLKDVFDHTHFLKIKTKYEGMVQNSLNENNYKEALIKIANGNSSESVIEFLKQKNYFLKYVAIYQKDDDVIVLGYNKPKGKFKVHGGASNISSIYTFDGDLSLHLRDQRIPKQTTEKKEEKSLLEKTFDKFMVLNDIFKEDEECFFS